MRGGQALLAVLVSVLLCSCASLTSTGWHQYVPIRTDPPGIQVLENGETRGTTPQFVKLHRSTRSLLLSNGTETQTLTLKRHYRWNGSFWSNLIFLTYAPVGWVVDWTTGALWEVEDPPVVVFRSKAGPTKQPRLRIAIAPPLAKTLAVADEAGQLWEQRLHQRYPQAEILRYHETLPAFIRHHYDFDLIPSREDEAPLAAELEVQQVLTSRVDEQPDRIVLTSELQDVFTHRVVAKDTLSVKTDDLDPGLTTWYERTAGWLHVLPNTASIEWASNDTQISVQEHLYDAAPPETPSFMTQTATYLGALDLTRLTPPRFERGSVWRFQFVPAIRVVYRELRFPQLAALNNIQFNYLQLSGGLGPEIGWQYGRGYLYLNFIPLIGWHRLTWERESEESRISEGAITTRTELGYLWFLSDHLSARIFSKNTTAPNSLWHRAMDSASNGALNAKSVSDVSAGIAFGYTFGSRRDHRRWSQQEN